MKNYIVSDPNILGGTPVVIGTRVPIETILYLLKDGYPLEVIHDDYPQISMETLSGAIDEAIHQVNSVLHAKGVSQTQNPS
jgi:uncharacterized protein (DUF433 family)